MNKVNGRDIFDILLDESNDSDIVILDNDGKEIIMEQVMTIPYYNEYQDKDEMYCLLHPKNNTKYYSVNNVYPFLIANHNGHYELEDVTDEDILNELNHIYETME